MAPGAPLRPDAIIQGLGCWMMAATTVFVIHALIYGSETLDVPPGEGYSAAVAPLLMLLPCCVCCGGMMLWSGCGGQFPAASAAMRCDLPARPDRNV